MGLWSGGMKRAETGEERIGERYIDRTIVQKILDKMRLTCSDDPKLRGYKFDVVNINGNVITWDIANKLIKTIITENTTLGILTTLLAAIFEANDGFPHREIYMKVVAVSMSWEHIWDF